MYRNLNNMEKKWIEKLLDIDFKERDILVKQILKAQVIYKKEYAFISLKFVGVNNEEKYPYQIRVPVEMRAYQDEGAPIVFLLHIINGLVNELEIISADSSELREEAINLNNVEYELNKEVM